MHNVPDILLNNTAKIVIDVAEVNLRKKPDGEDVEDEPDQRKEFKRFPSFRRTFRLNKSFKRSKSTETSACKYSSLATNKCFESSSVLFTLLQLSRANNCDFCCYSWITTRFRFEIG